MEKKAQIDLFGSISLILFSLVLGFNHVVIKFVNTGLNPVFFSGIRSLGAVICILCWMKIRNKKINFSKKGLKWGVLAGIVFAVEFLFLFLALDYTTVVRNSIIYYSMPVWLALMAHFLLPNDRMTLAKLAGLLLAFFGMAWAISNYGDSASIRFFIGDLLALGGAIGWALLIIIARGTQFSENSAEMQLLWMVAVSAPILIIASYFFGDPIRDFQVIHVFGVVFQIVIVATGAFIFWLWLLSIYPASGVASFSFLSPVFGILFGWLILEEPIDLNLIFSAILVVVGITLVNRPKQKITSS